MVKGGVRLDLATHQERKPIFWTKYNVCEGRRFNSNSKENVNFPVESIKNSNAPTAITESPGNVEEITRQSLACIRLPMKK